MESENLLINGQQTLYTELQHRMKNNLQLILSLISIQIEKEIDKANEEFLISLKNRIQSISIANGMLNHTFNQEGVNISSLTENLVDNISKAYNTRSDISINLCVENVKVEQHKAIPYGLILNEILTNSFKYAFPEEIARTENRQNTIEVVLKKENQKNTLIVSNNGCPINIVKDVSKLKSSGLKLVYSLTEQLGGCCKIDNSKGSCFVITF